MIRAILIVALLILSSHTKGQDFSILNNCPIYGDNPRFSYTDSLKNRFFIPDTGYQRAPLEYLAGLSVNAVVDQSKLIVTEGYVILVKNGGSETCNCHTKDKDMMDTHIVLVADSNQDETDGVVVEVTPRIREQLPDYSTVAIKSTYTSHWIRVYGYIFNDKEHKAMSKIDGANADNTHRATCWEIHPVTKIELIR